MAIERIESQPRRLEISPHVQPASALVWNGVAVPDVSRPSRPECAVSTNGFDQTAGRSAGVIRLFASAPTSTPSGSPCNKSEGLTLIQLLMLSSWPVCIGQRTRTRMPPDPREEKLRRPEAKITMAQPVSVSGRPQGGYELGCSSGGQRFSCDRSRTAPRSAEVVNAA
jgi:hypothetical protein